MNLQPMRVCQDRQRCEHWKALKCPLPACKHRSILVCCASMTGCSVKVRASRCFGFTYARSTPGVYSKNSCYKSILLTAHLPERSTRLSIDDGHQEVAGKVTAGGQARKAAADHQHPAPRPAGFCEMEQACRFSNVTAAQQWPGRCLMPKALSSLKPALLSCALGGWHD